MADAVTIEQVVDQLDTFRGGPVAVSELPGGMTNRNFKVVTADGAFAVRLWSEESGLLGIDRDNEHHNSVAASEVGVGAPVVEYRPDLCVLVLRFLEGETLSPPALRRGDRLGSVAEACRRLHQARPFRDDFDMFALQQRYRAVVEERGLRLPPRYDEFVPQVDAIREALAVRAGPLVPCHNDLLAENLLDVDGCIRLVDFEYSGNNDASFEIGNIWSESNLSLPQLEQLVAGYDGRLLRHRVARARLWGLVSKYGWTLWASIQEGISPLPFDFWAWGQEKYDRAVAEFDHPGFERLLEDAARPD